CGLQIRGTAGCNPALRTEDSCRAPLAQVPCIVWQFPMSDNTPRPSLQSEGEKPVALPPGFFRAWLGIWSLTWRVQFTWRRLPFRVLTLLAIPGLTFFTLEPLQHWTTHYDWREKPGKLVNEFKAKAMSANARLNRGNAFTLTQIIDEEQSRVEL